MSGLIYNSDYSTQMDYLTYLNWYPSRLIPVPDRLRLSATTAEALKARTKGRGLEGPDHKAEAQEARTKFEAEALKAQTQTRL